MSRTDFVAQLKELGYNPTESTNRVTFPYRVSTGKFAGNEITLGFIVEDSFPLTPPSGPHVSPRLLPITGGGGQHPLGGVHESQQFGSEWEYWSRPYPQNPGWANTDRKVRTYMAHITNLFATQ